MKKKLLCVSVALALAGCGGSDGGGGNGNSSSTGVLLDSPVAGIGYRTESKTGFTNEFGEYQYRAGETVIFFIGDLEFPPVTATGTVTPADMTSDPAALTNILQLLQSLDEDGNPDNGITIHEDAAAAFAGSSLDFTSATFDTDVLTPLAAIGSGLALVAEEQAEKHFRASLRSQLLGSWLIVEGPGMRNVLTFIDDSRYVIIHEHDDGDQQGAGTAEFGYYSWNPLTKQFSVEVIAESDGTGGLSDNDITMLEVSGDTLVLNGDTPDTLQISRVRSEDNPLVGAWFMANPDDPASLDVITFLSSKDYVIAHTNNSGVYAGDTLQPLSGEFGTYNWDGSNFTVTAASVDTDGDAGLFNADADVGGAKGIVDIEDWGTLKFDDGVEVFALARIGQFSVELVDDPDGKGVDSQSGVSMGTINVQRDVAGFAAVDVQDSSWRIDVRFASAYADTCLHDFGDGTCGSAFRFDLSAGGTGFAEEIYEHAADPADGRWPATWSINSAGEIKVVFDAIGSGLEEEFFTATIAKLHGVDADGNNRVMLALEAVYEDTGEIFEEDSLWESVLTPIVIP